MEIGQSEEEKCQFMWGRPSFFYNLFRESTARIVREDAFDISMVSL
jgi:hypothetical protein